jgi:hypothetical protein
MDGSRNAMNAAEWDDYLRMLKFAYPALTEEILKAYRMAETGSTRLGGRSKQMSREPIRVDAPEAAA